MEPVSRASAWRKGFKNPADYNDNEGYCGGYSHQWLRSRGKCGVCGDPWGQRPRNHEAPGGRYANGIIVKEYRVGEMMEVEIDLSANHRGSFTFKLCQNNNVRRDSHQRCFDRHTLKVYPEMTESFELPSEASQTFYIQLKLPEGVTCKQCVLQWTYNTANSWGNCPNQTNAIGCGPQETFRACSDIRISRSGKTLPKITTKRPEIIGNRAPDKGVFYYNSFTGGNSIGGSSNDLPSGPPTPVPSPFKFVWFNRDIDLVPPSRPDASTSVAVTTRKPKRRKRPKRPRKKIKDRPRRKKKKNRKNRRRNRNRNRKNRRKNRRKSTTTTIPRLLGGTSFDREFTTPPTSLTTTTTTQRAPLIFTSPSPPPEDPEVHGIDSQIALISTNSFIKPKSEEGTIIDPSNFDPGAELDKFWDHLRSKKGPKTKEEPSNFLKSVKGDPTETPRNSGWPKMTQNEDNPNSNSRQRSRNCEGLACTAFVSISFGNPDQDVNFNLGPGQAVHAMDKLKELEASLNCEGLSCLDVY